jgi:hypothetical protein
MKNKSIQQQLDWLEKEKKQDELILNKEKIQLINQIKKVKKDEIFPIKPKLTLWQRIKKVLMN